jgi:phosphatidate cytidylyltransferase
MCQLVLSPDRSFLILIGLVVALLTAASRIAAHIHRKASSPDFKESANNLVARIQSWWLLVSIFCAAIFLGKIFTIFLFLAISFLALREMLVLTPVRKADHKTLLSMFFLVLPIQYYLVACNWYGLFAIFIPVYMMLFVPVRNAIAGDTTNFLERSSELQWALLLCVYFPSHAAALLNLNIPGFDGQNYKLLCFLIIVTQSSDVLQYIFGKLFGKTKICPSVSPNKTVEGLIGGVVAATCIGTALWWLTPFSAWQAALMSVVIALAGFCGGLVLSSIKRDRGIKDFGTLIPGHGGMLDRIDSLCFAAPIFFHLTRYFFAH